MKNTLLIVNKEGVGVAPESLQTVLAINFFRNLVTENKTPGVIFFYAEGIKLNIRGSIIEDSLLELEKRGTKILTCTTCLNYFNSKDELLSGSPAGMSDLVNEIARCDKVVSL
jgi:sulfur relay (sulfurtransferase) complex TusBCD TusD component (DsrE family)